MIWALRISFGLVAFLVFIGGWVFKTPIGRIEVGSVDPWAWLGAFLLGVAYWGARGSFNRFVEETYSGIRRWCFPEEAAKARKAVLVLVFGALGLVFVAHLFRYWRFDSNLFDMGMVNQAIFHPWYRGTVLHSNTSPHQSYLVDHFAPVLLLLAPVTAWFHSNAFIFAVQAALLAFGLWVLVSFGPLKARPSLIVYAAFILLCNRSYRNGGFWDFREDVFGFVFLSIALAGLIQGRLRIYFAALVGYVISKEHLGVLGLGLVFPIFLDPDLPYSKKQRLWIGAGTLVFLLAWCGLLFGAIIPRLQAGVERQNNIARHFQEFGSTPGQVIFTLLTSPRAWWAILKTSLLTKLSLKYLFLIAAPYFFFIRKSWSWALAAALGVAANIASDSEIQKSLFFHYDLGFMPFLMMGALQGIRRMDLEFTSGVNRKLLLGLLLALCFSGRWPMFMVVQNIPAPSQIADARFAEQVPCAGIISANSNLLSKLTHCAEFRPLPLANECEDPVALYRRADSARYRAGVTEFLLDREAPCERKFEQALVSALPTPGDAKIEESPSRRLVYFVLKAPVWEN